MRTTVRLPEDLLHRAKLLALSRQTTLTALIEEGLREVLDAPRAPDVEPVRIPVSRARGGTWPGVELRDTSVLLDRVDGLE